MPQAIVEVKHNIGGRTEKGGKGLVSGLLAGKQQNIRS